MEKIAMKTFKTGQRMLATTKANATRTKAAQSTTITSRAGHTRR